MKKKSKRPSVRFAREETRNKADLAAGLRGNAYRLEYIEKQTNEDFSKLVSLCQHYGIEAGPLMFTKLALTLAREMFPERKRSGAKTKWTSTTKGMLVVEIERLADPRNPAHGISWACKRLAKVEPWKSFVTTKDLEKPSTTPEAALRQAYYEAVNDPRVGLYRDAYSQNQLEGHQDQWNEALMHFVRNREPD